MQACTYVLLASTKLAMLIPYILNICLSIVNSYALTEKH